MEQLTAADIDKTDPKKLAEALRTYCNKAINCDAFMDPPGVVPRFALALLAVLDECEKCRHTKTVGSNTFGRIYETGKHELINDIIRTAARAYYGGTLREVSHA